MKKLGAGTAVSAGMLSIAGSSYARPGAKAIEPGEAPEPNPDFKPLKVDRSVETLSAHYLLLTLREDAVMSYIDDSGLSKKEIREAKQAVAKLRRKFPVRKEEGEDAMWLTLAVDRDSTEEDGKHFEKAGRAFAKGAGGRMGFTTMHEPNLHEKMTNSSCNEMWLSDDKTTTLTSYASKPDNPNVQLDVPDWVYHDKDIESALTDWMEDVIHHVGQYYDADPFWGDYECYHNTHDADFSGLGKAPTAADYQWDTAKSYCCETEEEYVGRLTHFPQDMSQPLHTGMGWEQAGVYLYYDSGCDCVMWGNDPKKWIHYGYEDYVHDRWNSSPEDFHYHYDSNKCSGYCYYSTSSGAEAVTNMSDYSGQYSYDVFHHISNEGSRYWEDWDSTTRDRMKNITQNCLNEGGLWVRGCIHEFYG